jgi:hypothetical protein
MLETCRREPCYAASAATVPRLSGAELEARRDLVGREYVDLQRTQDEIADAHGLTRGIVSHDLKVLGIEPRPRGWRPGTTISEEARRRISEGARAWNRSDEGRKRLTDPPALERLQDGNRRYRDDVERVKAERGLIDTDGLLERLRRARLPRSKPMIGRYIRAGLIEPERSLGFDKPRLFTEASVDQLVTRLRESSDGRHRRMNDPHRRGLAIQALQGLPHARRAWGRSANADRERSAQELERQIRESLRSDMRRKEIAERVGCTERHVTRVAKRLGLSRKPGRPPAQ